MNEFNKSPDEIADDAKHLGQDAVDKAKDVASGAQRVAGEAANTGRTYAKDALDAAGKKIDAVKSQYSQTADYLTKAIHDDPVKAVLVTAVVSSALTAMVLSLARGDRYQ